MQKIPSVERAPAPRPGSAMDMAAPAAAKAAPVSADKVIPVAPVNPPAKAPVMASVVNNINPEVQARARQDAQAMQVSAPDPLRGGAQADNNQRDWTERKPAPQKVEAPPKEPISKMLIEHINAMWAASAKAVEMWYMSSQGQNQDPNQLKNLTQTRNQDPSAVPGTLAKSTMSYTPSRVEKNEASSNSSRSGSSDA